MINNVRNARIRRQGNASRERFKVGEAELSAMLGADDLGARWLLLAFSRVH